jgi:hypothetical protein
MRPTWSSRLTDWQAKCVQYIEAGLLEYEAQQVCLGGTVDHQECKKWISLNKYPFGLRQNHPYAVWRQEVAILDVFFTVGIAFRHYKTWRKNYKKIRKPNQNNEKQKKLTTKIS